MATPKKGSRPIKITLTENQLSDIISQTARTRKGLKAESLEDRIAPSMIGAPLDPSLVPLPDSGTTDPIAPSPDGTFGDPTLNDAGTPYNPFLPPPDPSNPPLPGQPLPAGYDPTVAPTFIGGATPQFPGGFGMQYGPAGAPPAPFIAPDPNAPPPPPSPFAGSGAPTNSGGLFGGQSGSFSQFDPNAPLVGGTDPGVPLGEQPYVPPENPADLLQGDGPFVPPTDPGIPDEGKVAPTEPTDGGPIVPGEPSPEGPAPSAEELQNHRQNILRQLRGQ